MKHQPERALIHYHHFIAVNPLTACRNGALARKGIDTPSHVSPIPDTSVRRNGALARKAIDTNSPKTLSKSLNKCRNGALARKGIDTESLFLFL